jgi:VWFA-related protein
MIGPILLVLLGQAVVPAASPDAVSVRIRGADERAFPEITLDYEVRRPDGTPLLDARVEDFRVTEAGQPVEVLSFVAPRSVTIRPTSVVLVLDTSGSMIQTEDRMTPLKQAVATFLEVMPEGSEVGIIAFASSVREVCPLTTDRQRVREAVRDLRAGGNTRFYDAVEAAIALLADRPGRRAILALTDGEDTMSRESTLESAIAAARAAGLPVHTLGVGNEAEIASADLQTLAEGTRGRYLAARDADQLAGIYEEVAQSLRDSYSLTYRTQRRIPDGTLRPVEIFYRAATQAAGQTAVFIPGMVAPAAGWSRLFVALLALLGLLAALPGYLKRRGRRSAGPGAT